MVISQSRLSICSTVVRILRVFFFFWIEVKVDDVKHKKFCIFNRNNKILGVKIVIQI